MSIFLHMLMKGFQAETSPKGKITTSFIQHHFVHLKMRQVKASSVQMALALLVPKCVHFVSVFDSAHACVCVCMYVCVCVCICVFVCFCNN